MEKCPICSDKKIKLKHKIDNFKYYLCAKCKTLILGNNSYSSKKLKMYYKEDFEYTAAIANEKRIKKQANKILKKLKSINPNGKTLLDIGSGFGFFLEEAKKFKLKTLGIEPSLKLAKLAKNKNLKIVNQTFEEYFSKNPDKKFDYITIIHVLEHIKNPRKWLKMAFSLLNKNGVIYIETPNLDSHLYRAEKDRYTFLTPPDHLWIFSSNSLTNLIKNISSLKVIKISTYSYPEHLIGIIKTIFKNKNNYLKKNINPNNRKPNKNKGKSITKKIKYVVFDRILAPLFTPILNINQYGSILGLYIKKK